MDIEDENAPPRVKNHHKDLLLKGIPVAIPRTGKPKSVRQKRAESLIHEFLMAQLIERKIWALDDSVCTIMNSPDCVIEITRVEVSHDIRNITVYWTPPFTLGLVSEEVVEKLNVLMMRYQGAFRTMIAEVAGKRFAPYVEVLYDKKFVKDLAKEALERSFETGSS